MRSFLLHITKILVFAWYCFLLSITITSCSITNKIPDGSYLLVKNKISCDSKYIDTEDMLNYIKQKPNRNTFFIKYHLRMYYAFEKSTKKTGTWIRETIGEPPVFFDEYTHTKTLEQLKLYMNEHGYYNSNVTSTIIKTGRKENKVKIHYNITAHELYEISKISYEIPDTNIADIILKQKAKSIVNENSVFDITLLKAEQKRLLEIIQNYGYYTFDESKIYYTADTSKGHKNVEITIAVKPNDLERDGLYRKYKIRNTYIYPDYSSFNTVKSSNTYDSIIYSPSVIFYCNNKDFVKPEVIMRANYIANDSIYSINSIQKTQRQLSQNKLFKLVTVVCKEVNSTDTLDSYRYLDCYIQIVPFTRQAVTFEVEGTNTGGDWGAEITGAYIHKNIFHGAENLSIKAKAAGEYNKVLKTVNENRQLFNSHEFGGEINLETPIFLSPIKPAKFDYKYRPKTNFRIAYNFNKTADYTKPTTQLNYGYTWYGNSFSTHMLKPIDISYIYYYNKSQRFTDFVNSRDYYKYGYEDYVIYASNYSYIFYNKNSKSLRNYQYIRFNAESSGNLLYGILALTKNGNQNQAFKTFNVPFAQYLKSDLDLRYYQVFDSKKTIVYRAFGGLAIPLLNSEGLPSVKKYYSGGANSMRAWSNRALGPGSYIDTKNGLKYYMGDVKLEANIEARFHMFWIMDGAVFVDIGNIWSFRDNELPGAEFFAKSFYKELAVGTGYGIRFDFSFFVFRTDLGIKCKEPVYIGDTQSKFIWGNRPIKGEDFNLNIGIGYPF